MIKFYLKHHFGGGMAVSCFGADWFRTLVSMATDSAHRFRTLVSMATDSSHRVIIGKTVSIHFLCCF